eukprot:4211272-Lingulodinium_polyedra.AAC.1
MTRSNRPFAAAAARRSHVLHTPCKHQSWCLRAVSEACDARVVAAANGRLDRIIAHGFKSRAQ